jgi:branched-chain amino acid transport system permease protein
MILQIDPGLLLVLIRETAVLFAIYGIYVLSLNLEAGYLGLPQFGKSCSWR